MTEEVKETKTAVESDVEQDEDACSDDQNSVTTDDEFYNELMDAPPEREDHLIPDGCKDDIIGIEHLTSCLNRRYNSCPAVFTGTLQDALKEAFDSKEIKERRPLLIYVHNDKSLYSNLFCSQLLCNDTIIEFLLNNYVLWAWDCTFQSNGERLNEIYKTTFPQLKSEHQIGTYSTEYYPLLLGVYHHNDGDCRFNRLIDGSNKRPVVDEFLGRLLQFKDQFDSNEEVLERTKRTAAHMATRDRFRMTDLNHPSLSRNVPMDGRSSTMFAAADYGRNRIQDSSSLRTYDDDFFTFNRMNLSNTFRRLNINHAVSDDDDDDDDDGQTPTVDRPSPKYPK